MSSSPKSSRVALSMLIFGVFLSTPVVGSWGCRSAASWPDHRSVDHKTTCSTSRKTGGRSCREKGWASSVRHHPCLDLVRRWHRRSGADGADPRRDI